MSHNNAQEYANDIIMTILHETEKTLTPLELELMEYWFDEIKTKCESQFHSYLIGNAESYMLNENEIVEAYNEAKNKLVSDTLTSLLDKGAIEMSVNENGEICYQAK